MEATYVNFVKDPYRDANGNCTNSAGCIAPIWMGMAPALSRGFSIVGGASYVEGLCDGRDNDGDTLVDEGYPAGNTRCGASVGVASGGVTLTFDQVDQSGETDINVSNAAPQPAPSGYSLGLSPTYYNIHTSAIFQNSAEVRIPYDQTKFSSERNLRLLHLENDIWKDITTGLDTTADVIWGSTTSFSPFIVAESSASPTVITLQNFSANLEGGHVVLTWSTSFERDNEGFHIQRGESAGGPFVEITPSMIPAMDGPGMKATYTFTDSGVESGKTYYYRLQDVDSRGKVSTQRVVSVNTGAADGEKASQEGTSQKTEMVSTSDQKGQTAGRNSVQEQVSSADKPSPWTSVVVESNPLTLTPHKGGGSEENGRDAKLDTASGNAFPPNDMVKEEYSERPAATTGFVAHHSNPAITVDIARQAQGPSSLSVTIEDEKGNLIEISRREGDKRAGPASPALQVTEEAGSVVLIWEGMEQGRGFVIHRSEKDRGNYVPISGLIPYFGIDGKEIFLYRFKDNSMKPGTKYDYRLEVVKTTQEKDRHGAPPMISGQSLSLRSLR